MGRSRQVWVGGMGMGERVLVASFYNRQAVAPTLEVLARRADVVLCREGRRLTEDELIGHLKGMDAVIGSDEPYTERVFASSPRLRIVALDGVGFDNVDLDSATRHGVIVANAPVNDSAVADLTLGLMIAAVRQVLTCDRGMRGGRWGDRDRYLSRDVNGATLGLLGFGRVGKAVAKRAAGFGMVVLAYDPSMDVASAQHLGVRPVTMDELLAASDILSVHVPLTPATVHLLDAAALRKMKPGAYLVNTSRGAVVEEAALVAALESGQLAGAGLDVLCEEPPSVDNPLFRFDNVVLTPHVGSDTYGTFLRIFECAVGGIVRLFDGQRPDHVVNPAVLKQQRWTRLS